MKYQDCAEALQADNGPDARAGDAVRLATANINPATGLASDYLNHFNEAIMLLEMLPSCPDCRDDFLGWRPMSYREHFEASGFKGRALAIATYDAADPNLRGRLDALAAIMTAVLEATRASMGTGMPEASAVALAERAAQAVTHLAPVHMRIGRVERQLAPAARHRVAVDGNARRVRPAARHLDEHRGEVLAEALLDLR